MSHPLLAGERVIAVERGHPAILVPAAALTALAVAVLVFLVHLAPAQIGGWATGGAKSIAFAAICAAGLLWFLLRFLEWRCETYTLTSQRIVLSRGVISRLTESIDLDRVQDIIVRKTLADRLIRAGSVEIDSAARDGVEVLRLIPRPDRFYTEILQAVQDHRRLSVGYAWPAGEAMPPATPYGMQGGM
jgi:uncharacterized membrane protein YdbT with pleckstrin-like domain